MKQTRVIVGPRQLLVLPPSPRCVFQTGFYADGFVHTPASDWFLHLASFHHHWRHRWIWGGQVRTESMLETSTHTSTHSQFSWDMLVEPVQQLVYGCSTLPSPGADWLHQVIFLSLDLKTRAANLRAAHAASTSCVAHHGRKRSSLWSNYATVVYSSMHFPTLSNISTGSLK